MKMLRPARRLICFPYAAGSSLTYRPWQKAIPDVQVVALDYPGHLLRPRERLIRTMLKLVDHLAAELEPLADSPFVLCGSSLGALVAFEMAQVLEARGHAPRGLVVLCCPSPAALPLHPPIAGLPDKAFLEIFAERYGGSVRRLLDHPDGVQLILPMIRADMELFEDYSRSPGGTVSCPIIALAGRDDRAAPLEHVRTWGQFTTSVADVTEVHGGHFVAESNQANVLAALAGRISELLGPAAPGPGGRASKATTQPTTLPS